MGCAEHAVGSRCAIDGRPAAVDATGAVLLDKPADRMPAVRSRPAARCTHAKVSSTAMSGHVVDVVPSMVTASASGRSRLPVADRARSDAHELFELAADVVAGGLVHARCRLGMTPRIARFVVAQFAGPVRYSMRTLSCLRGVP